MSSMEMHNLCTSPLKHYLCILLIVGLMVLPSNSTLSSPYQQKAAALGPEPELYLRFRKNTPKNRQTRSDEYIHPFIRFRKSTYSTDPYRSLYQSYVPANQ